MLVSLLGVFGGGAVFVLDRTEKCKDRSEDAIEAQHRLRTEIISRREAFVEAVTGAATMTELRDFPNHRDELHGYVFAELANRSLADLQDTQIWTDRNSDEPNSLSALLQAEFANETIEDLGSQDGTIARLRGAQAWKALQTQDVAALVDMDLPTLKERAAIERGWLFDAHVNKLADEYKTVPACSVGVTLRDLWYDYHWLNRPAIHIVHRTD